MTNHTFVWKGKEFVINELLRKALDTLVYNIKHNPHGKWDAMVIVSGDRRVGTGKSTMTQLMCAYCAYVLGVDYSVKDIYFDSQAMIDEALKKPDYSINHYDEARRGLVTSKRMSKVQEDLLDYYAECRQLHQINFLVLPDFFKLNEEIAVSRSEFLINVVRERKEIITDKVHGIPEPVTAWERGTFHFYRWETKKILYDIYTNTRKKDYWAINPDFHGNFTEQHVIPEKEYEEIKRTALLSYRKDAKKKVSKLEQRYKMQRDMAIRKFADEGKTNVEIAEFFSLDEGLISKIVREDTENEEENYGESA